MRQLRRDCSATTDVWDRWLSYDPVVSWRARVDNLRALQGILLDVGDHDDFDLHYGHRQLSQSLRSAGIAHQATEHHGSHGGRLPERIQVAMRWFSAVLEARD